MEILIYFVCVAFLYRCYINKPVCHKGVFVKAQAFRVGFVLGSVSVRVESLLEGRYSSELSCPSSHGRVSIQK